MKYKVGDKVRIIDNKYSHGFDIGEVVTINYIGKDDGAYQAVNERGDWWYVNDDELEDFEVITYSPETTAIVEMFMNAHSGKMSDSSRIEWPTAVNIARIYTTGLLNMYSGDSDWGVNELEEILKELNK